MPDRPSPRSWLLLAAGDARQHASNAGYDDNPAAFYRWDSTVPNHASLARGDRVVLWDKTVLLGASVVADIATGSGEKVVFRCPVCGHASFKQRPSRGDYRCRCSAEFAQPVERQVAITTYRADYEPGWTDLNGLVDLGSLRGCAVSPVSQLSLRPLDWSRFVTELGKSSPSRLLNVVEAAANASSNPANGASGLGTSTWAESHVLVRARAGLGRFRARLVERFGAECALTGPAPLTALEATHLYRYTPDARYEIGGGLLLRRDIHALFDAGLVSVAADRVCVDASLLTYPAYRNLDGSAVWAALGKREEQWLADHHRQSTGGGVDDSTPLGARTAHD